MGNRSAADAMTKPKRKAKNDRRRQRNEVRATMKAINSLKSQSVRHAQRKTLLLTFKRLRKMRRASALKECSVWELISDFVTGSKGAAACALS